MGEETSQKGLSNPASPSEIINPHQVTIPNSSEAELSEPSEAEWSDITLDVLSNQGNADHNDEAATGHFEHLGMSEETTPTLPKEILSLIIKYTLNLDMSMIGAFNRVSPLFRELTGRHLLRIYMRDALSQNLDIATNHDNVISVMTLFRPAV